MAGETSPRTGVGVCFPEPKVKDLNWGRHDPDQIGWLERSTRPQARGIRRHINENLAVLPADATAALCRRFRTDPWRPVYFELVVGRFLQLLGGTLEYEPAGGNRRKVDWRVSFADGSRCYVEATSPVSNAWVEEGAKARGPLLQIIEDFTAPGWSAIVSHVPPLGPQDSRAEFRRTVRSIMETLPDPSTVAPGDRVDRVGQVSQGTIELGFRPGRYGTSAIVGSTGGGGWDDTALRIEDAIRDKRHQGRAFPGEVVLAIDAPFGDREDCDVAMFGRTYSVMDDELKVVEEGFRRDGALTRQAKVEYPAVLVFMGLGMFGGRDPVMYLHPRLDRVLPAAFDLLERHRLDGDLIRREGAQRERIIDGLNFAGREE